MYCTYSKLCLFAYSTLSLKRSYLYHLITIEEKPDCACCLCAQNQVNLFSLTETGVIKHMYALPVCTYFFCVTIES